MALLKKRQSRHFSTGKMNMFLVGLMLVLLYPYIKSILIVGRYVSSNNIMDDYPLYPILSSNESMKQSKVSEKSPYKRHEGVVIVSKMMGHEAEVKMLMQSLCLITEAYNKHLNYDIVIFSTFEQDDETTNKVAQIVHPAKFRFVYENVTVADLMRTMTEKRRNFIIEKCNKTSIEDFVFDVWWEACPEIGQLRYNWQAQFRSLQIWKQEALAKYKYMVWMDCDLFCTRPWNKDPVNFFVENDLAVAFDKWDGDRGGGGDLQKKIKNYFNKTICKIYMGDDGKLTARTGDNCNYRKFMIIGGWFHMSNLDFFRSNIEWLETFIGEDQLSRNPDDQEALTTTAVLKAPGRAWDLHTHGMNLSLAHNGRIAGGTLESPRGFHRWWPKYGEKKFGKESYDKCTPYICCGM